MHIILCSLRTMDSYIHYNLIPYIAGNFGDFANLYKIAKFKTHPGNNSERMRAYQYSICQIKNSPIPSGGYFAKFNARQSFPLYYKKWRDRDRMDKKLGWDMKATMS